MDEKERRRLSLTSFIALFVFLALAITFSFGRSLIERINLSFLTLTGEVKIVATKPDSVIKQKVVAKKKIFQTAKKLIKVKSKKVSSKKISRKRPPEKGFYITSETTDRSSTLIKVGSKDHCVTGAQNWKDTDDLSYKCMLEKKENGFLVMVAVKDNIRWAKDENIQYRNDCIEIYFDVRPLKNRGNIKYEDRAVYQATVVPFYGMPKNSNTMTLRTAGKKIKVPDGCWVKSNAIPGGYKVEAFFPFSIFKYKPDDEFNFDIGIIDYDGNNSLTQMVWSGIKENYNNASYFGRMKPAK